MENPHEIDCILPDRLYIGSLHCRTDAEYLKAKGITHIIDLSSKEGLPEFEGIKYHILDGVKDGPNQDMTPIFTATNAICKEALSPSSEEGQGRVLIHCQQGISRSGSAIIYNLMALSKEMGGGMSLKESFKHAKSKRRIILPNTGFMKQLQAAEVDLHGETTLNIGENGQLNWL
jgi:hypothetical protein